jgi:hypothetical protein
MKRRFGSNLGPSSFTSIRKVPDSMVRTKKNQILGPPPGVPNAVASQLTDDELEIVQRRPVQHGLKGALNAAAADGTDSGTSGNRSSILDPMPCGSLGDSEGTP